MLILAFDTSGFAGSVALLDGPRVLRETALAADRRSAQTLAPAVAGLLADEGIQPRQVRLVATTVGPGSFTGLRVGITTAKTFAYAVGADVIGISTLEAIAQGMSAELLAGGEHEVHAVLDAQRKELFVSKFRVEPNTPLGELPRMTRINTDSILPIATWLEQLRLGAIVTGAGLAMLGDEMPPGILIAPRDYWEPRASIVGQLAGRDYQAGRRDDLWQLTPAYLRPSYAEERRVGPASDSSRRPTA